MLPIKDSVEDTEHFLLHCHSHHLQNQAILSYGLSSLSNEELVSIILYGDERLPFESNKAIIEETLDFIESLKIFLNH